MEKSTVRVAMTVRSFASEASQVQEQVRSALILLDKIQQMNQKWISSMNFMVPTNSDYIDCDCGDTVQALKAVIDNLNQGSLGGISASVTGTRKDPNVGLLNEAVELQARDGCTHSLVFSKRCIRLLTDDTLGRLVEAVSTRGAKISSLAMGELRNWVMDGLAENTACLWDIAALIDIGGFDQLSSTPTVNDPNKMSGVEETIPQIKLIRKHGPCFVPVDCGEETGSVASADPMRERKKMQTKLERRRYFASLAGVDRDSFDEFFKGGIKQ